MHKIRSVILSEEGFSGYTPLAPKEPQRRSQDISGGNLGRIRIARQEARTTDQRREDRERNLVEQVKIVFRDDEYEVPVVNTSARGLMIESGIVPHIGEAILIQLEDGARTQCFVRWIRQGRIGLGFREEDMLD